MYLTLEYWKDLEYCLEFFFLKNKDYFVLEASIFSLYTSYKYSLCTNVFLKAPESGRTEFRAQLLPLFAL